MLLLAERFESSILAARKLAKYDSGKRVSATVAAISDAVALG
jgi:hypothetical protein